ncbi:DUF262 domain-containing protein [Lutibacter maritimus]|uniref:GmrSD restriction endonucleases N-terminal domain-containing protein n=1 Tax=Lutibacter maritimus TaxID=593133 RepID=A0A1I6REI1_9FLAO|nr:DUF262 domain-containing protein [Lutibacter maritimus]SFS63147.1 Protein of unknown function DUF262 [Lutibacter maritimus]
MSKNNIELKAINDVLGYNFYIPSYQRGYRWTSEQVTALLNDLWEFKENQPTQEAGKEAPFYCLQPIAVKNYKENEKDYWEVIDGQQRLTTILIILYYFNETEFKTPKPIFNLKYQTRNDSEQFLKNIKDTSLAAKNVDYHHINQAFITISDWFLEKEKSNAATKNLFYPILINQTKVIWYEVNDGSDSIDIFTRLNMGKIPLTNAELVKALFLRKGNFKKESEDKIRLRQLQIASEWDKIENTLQDDSFWYFIYNTSNHFKYDTRIEYIFDLMKDKKVEDEKLCTFYKFNDAFEESKANNKDVPDIDNLWLEIKKYFLTFEEWYKNRELYHLVGFLIATNSDIKTIKLEAESKTKTEFKKYLKKEIRKKVKCKIKDLNYKNPLVKTILLLFNIQTIVSNKDSNMRFPFDRYETENWDIEHIRSQTDKSITGNSRKDWARDILEYFTGEKTKDKQQAIIDNSLVDNIKKFAIRLLQVSEADRIIDVEFNDLYTELVEYFKEDKEPDDIDSISNLALLDARTNRSYKNAMFPIKRKTILENDMTGTFIPLCTKNVFLKSYSKKLDEIMYWKNTDANDYLTAIEDTLKIYLPDQKD